MSKVLKLAALFLFLYEVILAAQWVSFPDKDIYEPRIVLIGLLLTATELLRRLTKNINFNLFNKKINLNLFNKKINFSFFNKKIGVIHVIPDEDAWKLGLTGFFIRLRGIFSTIAFISGLIFYINYWEAHREKPYVVTINENIPTTYLVYIALIAPAILYLTLAIYVKRRTIRSLKMKYSLHQLLHISRNEFCGLLGRTQSSRSIKKKDIADADAEHEQKHLIDFSNKTCNIIKDYFSNVNYDSTVSCAIRIAAKIPHKNDNAVGYVTIGRSDNLNKNREKTSQYISRDEGIPNFFKNINLANHGLLFYYDLDLAAKKGAYKKTNNDMTYKSDIKTLIVAPINGWNGKKVDLIGLLYINSKTSKILNPKHAELVAFAADSLAITYAAMFERLHSVNNMPQLISEDTDKNA